MLLHAVYSSMCVSVIHVGHDRADDLSYRIYSIIMAFGISENRDWEIAFSPDLLDAMHCVVLAWQGVGPHLLWDR